MVRPLAPVVAFLLPAALLGGAYGSQYIGGLYPCEMCWWQRWPHFAALPLALAAVAFGRRPGWRSLTVLAALAIMVSGAIGVFHAGVEYHWWKGLTRCAGMHASGSTADVLAQIMATPLIRCDQPQWSLVGISLAGWNAIFSLGGGGIVLWLTKRGR